MKDIIRMNQLAGIITEGQARKMMEVLNEEEGNDLDYILQKLKSKYDVSIKDDGIFLKTYYKNGSQKNWYTIKKVDDDMYRFSKGGRQLRDWSLDDLFSNLLDNPNLSL